MGKSRQLKKMKKFISQLPEIRQHVVHGTRIPGHELIKIEDLTEVEGKPIKPDAIYTRKSVVTKLLNHKRNIKKAYNKGGLNQVAGYFAAVQHFVQSQKQKNQDDSQTDDK